VVQAAAQARLSRRVLPQARGHHVAHDDLIYLLRLNPRTADGLSHSFSAEIGGRKG